MLLAGTQDDALDAPEQKKNPSGLYPDPDHPGRFHRRGRGNKSARVVRRITVYVDDELATMLDVYRAKQGNLTRSDVLEAALRAHIDEVETA